LQTFQYLQGFTCLFIFPLVALIIGYFISAQMVLSSR
jgi:hypothetical protein